MRRMKLIIGNSDVISRRELQRAVRVRVRVRVRSRGRGRVRGMPSRGENYSGQYAAACTL